MTHPQSHPPGPSEDLLSQPPEAGLARQVVRGSAAIMAATGVTVSLGFVRSVLLARWLLPEDFGVVGLAMVFVILANRLRSFGLTIAILHKQVDSGPYYTTFFTLHTVTVIVGALVYLALTPLVAAFYPGPDVLAPVMMVLIVVTSVGAMNRVQETILRMHFRFDRLAWVNVAASVVMTLVAPYLAWRGWGVWSLVAQEASGILVRAVLLWGPWRTGTIAFGWDPAVARWLVRFGLANWVSINTNYLLERFDDFWVGTTLGSTALGFYNRAYEFARYPRRLIATSLVTVMTPVFARLQDDQERLSKTFFRVLSLLVRVGLLVGGGIFVMTPEFVYYVLGEKWLPMVLTLQLMALYMVLDPLLIMGNNLLLALGLPTAVARTRLMQLAFFVPGVIAGAWIAGIHGVALAANGMLLVGLGVVYRYTRQHVRYSLRRMIGWPLVAAASGIGGVLLALGGDGLQQPQHPTTALLKAAIFVGLFVGLLATTERRELLRMARSTYTVWQNARSARRTEPVERIST